MTTELGVTRTHNAGSPTSEASAKNRSVLLAVDAEPSASAARGPRERHLGAGVGPPGLESDAGPRRGPPGHPVPGQTTAVAPGGSRVGRSPPRSAAQRSLATALDAPMRGDGMW